MDLIPEGVFVAPKKVSKEKQTHLTMLMSNPILSSLNARARDITCYLVELKDGDTFDTKIGQQVNGKSLHRFMIRHLAIYSVFDVYPFLLFSS